MVDSSTVAAFVNGYLTAWRSNEPDDIRAIFAPDASYRFAPFEEPVVGHDAIVEEWLDGRDEPDAWTFEWEPVAIDGDKAIIEARTVYVDEAIYRNLWIIDFGADGLATEFTEWYMGEPEDDDSDEDGDED
ncbi:MAG: nuclear transport factor 2 family protein [Naasia sp.]